MAIGQSEQAAIADLSSVPGADDSDEPAPVSKSAPVLFPLRAGGGAVSIVIFSGLGFRDGSRGFLGLSTGSKKGVSRAQQTLDCCIAVWICRVRRYRGARGRVDRSRPSFVSSALVRGSAPSWV